MNESMAMTSKGQQEALIAPSGRAWTAFGCSVPIGVLGGLIGLGGAEFRLPVLVGPLGYAVKQAVPLNLAVSMFTLVASLLMRGWTLSFAPLEPFRYGIGAVIVGAMFAAYLGVALVGRFSEAQLHRVVLCLLLGIGGLLMAEAFLPTALPALLPRVAAPHIAAGLVLGMGIGLVSSLLGVAGGELIIPTLVFVYGADIKTAGTASLLISIPTVLVGIVRYRRRGHFAQQADLRQTVWPMGVGSVIGALIGGGLVAIAPGRVLKLVLGMILIVSAVRMFAHRASGPSEKQPVEDD